MSFYWVKTNMLIKKIFPNYVWDIPNFDQKIYLTFDDGPTPEITEWILDELKKHHIKATFFCLGDNIVKHPELFQKVCNEGHTIGNHTFNHLNGWNTSTDKYITNVSLCEESISNKSSEIKSQNSKIFRPPYGKIKLTQSRKLRQLGYKIIMWDVLSADYDRSITPQQCLENAVSKTISGSIIVFHDSVKAFKNLEFALPKAIEILKEKGFVFDTLS